MSINHKENAFASRLRNFVVEFLSVFSIVALNGSLLFSVLLTTINKGFDKSTVALAGALYLLFGCTVSTGLIYFVKGRVYHNKIKVFYDTASKVAKGDFNVRVPVYFDKPKSEMDYLAVNFNKMLTEISSLENMRNNFVADVSHEIKTPLSVIQGYADLLQNQDLSVEKRSEYTFLLSKAITSLTNLVTNILKLNKIENQGIIQKEKFSLDEQIRNCILSFEDKIEEKNIKINVDLDEVTLKSDRALLEIVWNNLISNALKYTSYGGTVSIDLKKDKNSVIVRVADDGCGISREMQKHIFDKFYQGDASHSQEGNGLGLALVKQVVNMLDYKIEVESVLGRGSEFKVVI